eukprot:m.173070 g.173070  ORF g.173070 m.173070 type:complete len:262 (-) comp25238_c1_seq1:228-1013(-)
MAEEEGMESLFREPEGFYPPPAPPTTQELQLSKHKLRLRLVGNHSLWAHCLWNASVVLSKMIEADPTISRGKNILELGAAAAVPSLTAVLCEAKVVVATDYPDPELIENIIANINTNIPEELKSQIHAKGFKWGTDVTPLLELLPAGEHFDTIFLSDLVFNHNQHHAMLQSCLSALGDNKDGKIYCLFSHHRPWKAKEDNAFLTIAQEEYHLEMQTLEPEKMPVMFPEDPGSEETRSTIHRYIFTPTPATYSLNKKPKSNE